MGVRVPLLAPFPDSSMVEHSAVNRVVVGSSPTQGASGSVAERFKALVLKTSVVEMLP